MVCVSVIPFISFASVAAMRCGVSATRSRRIYSTAIVNASHRREAWPSTRVHVRRTYAYGGRESDLVFLSNR